MFSLEKTVRAIESRDRIFNNPDRPKISDTIEKQLGKIGFLRLCIFVCPKFNTEAIFSGTPEKYMPTKTDPDDLFGLRIKEIRKLRQDLTKAGLPNEINIVIGDNDAEEYIFPFIEGLSFNPDAYKKRKALYKYSFEQRCRREFGNRVVVWSLAEFGVSQDESEPCIPEESLQKEIVFFRWLFSGKGPYRGTLNFSKETLVTMAKMKYRLYGAQGKFLEGLGGILLQTEGPGVWLERTNMLRCTGSLAIPAIYPWIRAEEIERRE